MEASSVIIVLGVIATAIYLYCNQPYGRQERDDNSNGDNASSSACNSVFPESSKYFILQYEQINERVRSRENVTVVVGSLFVTSSFMLLGSSAGLQQGTSPVLKEVLVFASLALYAIWLLAFSLPANIMSSRELFQLRKMESTAEFRVNVHTYLWEDLKNRKWFNWVRRQIWIYPFWALIFASALILKIA